MLKKTLVRAYGVVVSRPGDGSVPPAAKYPGLARVKRSGGGVVSGRRSKVVMAAGISLAAVVGVAGVAAAQQLSTAKSAKDNVTSALASFDDAKSVAYTVSLDTSVTDIAAISKAEGSPMSRSDQRNLSKIIGGHVVVNIVAPPGKTLGDLTTVLGEPAQLRALLKDQASASVEFQNAGVHLVEVRSIAGVIYARADVKRIATVAGWDPAQFEQVASSVLSSKSTVVKAEKGQWLSLDVVKAGEEAKSGGLLKSSRTTGPSASVDPAMMQKLITDLKSAYRHNASITQLGQDSTKGTGYRLGAPARQVARAVEPDLAALNPTTNPAEIKKDLAQIPDKTFHLDLWVKNGNLTDVSFDLTQFLTKANPSQKLTVDIAVDVNGGKVNAPAHATNIDVKSLLSPFLGGTATGSGGTPGTGDQGSGLYPRRGMVYEGSGQYPSHGTGDEASGQYPSHGTGDEASGHYPSRP